ncbi:hypothetical protein HDE_13214 [Halotydeus destructor]|nr:hypothetical protein HDE_13214 [Halotydeus destructor]
MEIVELGQDTLKVTYDRYLFSATSRIKRMRNGVKWRKMSCMEKSCCASIAVHLSDCGWTLSGLINHVEHSHEPPISTEHSKNSNTHRRLKTAREWDEKNKESLERVLKQLKTKSLELSLRKTHLISVIAAMKERKQLLESDWSTMTTIRHQQVKRGCDAAYQLQSANDMLKKRSLALHETEQLCQANRAILSNSKSFLFRDASTQT